MEKKLDAKGRWRNKASSFMMSPEEWEDLDTRVRLSGLTKQEQSQEEEIAETRTKRSNNSFKLLNISVGEEIYFLHDESIVARVVNDRNKIEYENEVYSVTALAQKLLIERHGWSEDLHVNGWRYFTKNGLTLSDLRDRIENEESDED